MESMSSDDNHPFFKMEDFMPVQLPWESYGIMMNPFPAMMPQMIGFPEVPAHAQPEPEIVEAESEPEPEPDQQRKRKPFNIPKALPQVNDGFRNKLRDNLTEALKMVAVEQAREQLSKLLNNGGLICQVNFESEMSESLLEDEFQKPRSKLPVRRGKVSDGPPNKKMKADSESDPDSAWDGKVTERARLLAKDIEIELLKIFQEVNKKYREKARSLHFNLKDKNNPELRARVFFGEISPQELCSMSRDQLANKELSQWRMAKAEERSQMVVITDEDVNPSKLVKKTHKGEVILEVDNDLPVSAPETKVVSRNEEQKAGAEVSEEKPENAEAGEKFDASTQVEANEGQRETPVHDVGCQDIHETAEVLLDASDFKGLPEIMSMDGFLKSLGCPVREDGSLLEDTKTEAHEATPVEDMEKATPVEDMEMTEAVESEQTVSKQVEDTLRRKSPSPENTKQAENALKRKSASPDSEQHGSPKVLKQSEIAGQQSARPSPRGSNSGEQSTSKGKTEAAADDGQQVLKTPSTALWDGSLQLTGTRSTAVRAVFRSGHEVKLNGWPKLLEVKGRVKLNALAKFLKDLVSSKSRAVTGVSFYSSDMATSSLSLLKEVVDQYEKGERVGFLEPATGYELYLMPPGSASWKFLAENNGRLKLPPESHTEKTEVLAGCIVWRKTSTTDPHKSKKSSSKNPKPSHRIPSKQSPPPREQSVNQHSVNEWQQQQQQVSQSLLLPVVSQSLSLPQASQSPSFPLASPLAQLSTVLSALMPGTQMPGFDGKLGGFDGKLAGFEGPPGFWKPHDLDDLPEYDYEGQSAGFGGSSEMGPPYGYGVDSQNMRPPVLLPPVHVAPQWGAVSQQSGSDLHYTKGSHHSNVQRRGYRD